MRDWVASMEVFCFFKYKPAPFLPISSIAVLCLRSSSSFLSVFCYNYRFRDHSCSTCYTSKRFSFKWNDKRTAILLCPPSFRTTKLAIIKAFIDIRWNFYLFVNSLPVLSIEISVKALNMGETKVLFHDNVWILFFNSIPIFRRYRVHDNLRLKNWCNDLL